jgi:hypothetical protein
LSESGRAAFSLIGRMLSVLQPVSAIAEPSAADISRARMSELRFKR